MTSPVENQEIGQIASIVARYETDVAKQSALTGFALTVIQSASMLTLDDIAYLNVQLTLAWRHPVALLSQLQQPCAPSLAPAMGNRLAH
jgi:hypothetical protein